MTSAIGGSVVVNSLFTVAPIVCSGSRIVFYSCFVMQLMVSFLVLPRKRQLDALLLLCSCRPVFVLLVCCVSS